MIVQLGALFSRIGSGITSSVPALTEGSSSVSLGRSSGGLIEFFTGLVSGTGGTGGLPSTSASVTTAEAQQVFRSLTMEQAMRNTPAESIAIRFFLLKLALETVCNPDTCIYQQLYAKIIAGSVRYSTTYTTQVIRLIYLRVGSDQDGSFGYRMRQIHSQLSSFRYLTGNQRLIDPAVAIDITQKLITMMLIRQKVHKGDFKIRYIHKVERMVNALDKYCVSLVNNPKLFAIIGPGTSHLITERATYLAHVSAGESLYSASQALTWYNTCVDLYNIYSSTSYTIYPFPINNETV